MLEDFNRDYEELKRRVSALESRPLELDIYKDLPPVLTADDLIDFLHIGTTKAYEILDLIGFKGRAVEEMHENEVNRMD